MILLVSAICEVGSAFYSLMTRLSLLRQEEEGCSQGSKERPVDRQVTESNARVSLDQTLAATDVLPAADEVDPGAAQGSAGSQCTLTPFGRVLCRPDRAVPFISVPAAAVEVVITAWTQEMQIIT